MTLEKIKRAWCLLYVPRNRSAAVEKLIVSRALESYTPCKHIERTTADGVVTLRRRVLPSLLFVRVDSGLKQCGPDLCRAGAVICCSGMPRRPILIGEEELRQWGISLCRGEKCCLKSEDGEEIRL